MADDITTIDSVPIASVYQSDPVFYLGPILLASELDCVLLGCIFIQAWLYFSTFQKDALRFKLLVAAMVLINCGQSSTNIAFTFATFVKHFGDWNYLPLEPWVVVIALDSAAAGLSQVFFLSRAWTLATRRGRTILAPCFLTIPAAAALGLGTAILMSQAPGSNVVNFLPLVIFNNVSYAWKAICIATDLLLTATIIYYLRKSATGVRFASTDRLVSKISRYTFESQLLPLLASLFLLITNAQNVNSNLVLFGSFGDTKLCACSILHCLNSRKKMRNEMALPTNSFVSPLGRFEEKDLPVRNDIRTASSTTSPRPSSSSPDPIPLSLADQDEKNDEHRKGDVEMQLHDFQQALDFVSRPATPTRERSSGPFWRRAGGGGG